MNRRIMLLLLLLAAIGCDGAEEVAGPKTIPDKTVVLTFDDGVLSHLTTVMPLLKELGFGATFYATFAYMKDWENYLDWKEIAEFHKAGFEVGNHTWTSAGFQDPDLAPQLLNELRGVESRLAEVGVPSPVTLAWPGCAFGPEALAELEKTGVQFARRGMQPSGASILFL